MLAAFPAVYPRVGGGNRSRRAVGLLDGGLSPRGRGKRRGNGVLGLPPGSIPAWAGETYAANKLRTAVEGLSPRGRGKPARYRRCQSRHRSIPAWAGETLLFKVKCQHPKVYPRVGGGNLAVLIARQPRGGLSPRGRGKHRPALATARRLRSIPAWAGETTRRNWSRGCPRVYPRVGGGNPAVTVFIPPIKGLSPRGRGKLPGVAPDRHPPGSIPAWAGETRGRPPPGMPSKVYPRVGGGNCRLLGIPNAQEGLSPRGRGKRLILFSRTASPRSIPAWAGKPAPGSGGDTQCRSIPAWAGETHGRAAVAHLVGVYPRVGGGNGFPAFPNCPPRGLSPRGRGKPRWVARFCAAIRSIPAWAGETRQNRRWGCKPGVYPRVGGGNPPAIGIAAFAWGLSPRGRGKPEVCPSAAKSARSIPAWAGETIPPRQLPALGWVYPRVGGGNSCPHKVKRRSGGLSPRGRGKLRTARKSG